MIWPEGKQFAFTIIDDTDNATLSNVKPVYDFLYSIGLKTTKTVWIYPPKDSYTGDCLQDEEYKKFILELDNKGFEIASHGVGSGKFTRTEIIEGFDYYQSVLNRYPKIHINHSQNENNLYWGAKRFIWPLSWFMKLVQMEFQGEREGSIFFWGDFAKKHVAFIRNLVFSEINTLKCDPEMPYRERSKSLFSNYWFSSSDGHTVEEFVDLIDQENINQLVKEGGCCIVYTHFASGFVNHDGKLDQRFKSRMENLVKQNGWFVPAGKILSHLRSKKKSDDFVHRNYLLKLNARWLLSRLKKRVKYNR
ncbi:MAG: hypothetical protein JNJ65_05990 [Cyclobacteriaceae bacterium]|nr:hypothetical protein [Cyclobacteriaceae bacterium]